MKVDTLFYNGKFFISPLERKTVNWLAVKRGRVCAFGQGVPDPSLLVQGQSIDLENKRVVPGLIDSHVHLLNMGLRRLQVDVSSCTHTKELIQTLKKRVYQKNKNRSQPALWIEAYGCDTEKFEASDRIDARVLDQVSRSIPVIVRRVDEHAMFVNSAVIRTARLNQTDFNLPGGLIERDDHGYPTGVLIDRAMDTVLRLKPKPSIETIGTALTEASHIFLEAGITSVHDMSMERIPLEVLAKMFRAGEYNLRVYAALYGEDAFEVFSEPKSHMFDYGLAVRAKKIFIDGALGSRGAWLSKPYNDDPSWSGTHRYDEKKLIELIQRAVRKRFQLIFHVLGDEASRWVLNILKTNFDPKDIVQRRFRFEHLEVFDPECAPDMRTFGIIASMQPWHALSDGPWIEKRLGKERFYQVSRLKGILSNGIRLCGGSDAPIEPHDPMKGMYAAVTRRPLSGKRDWLFEHKINLIEAIKMYTTEAAYAEFSEMDKGTLEIGKLADMAVLSDDIFHIHPRELIHVTADMTIVGGGVVFAKE